jgi:hypothetical protein
MDWKQTWNSTFAFSLLQPSVESEANKNNARRKVIYPFLLSALRLFGAVGPQLPCAPDVPKVGALIVLLPPRKDILDVHALKISANVSVVRLWSILSITTWKASKLRWGQRGILFYDQVGVLWEHASGSFHSW